MTAILLVSFILGNAIGSFINVLVFRARINEPITGRSFCPHCKKQLKWYELVPVLSFISQLGKCRSCKKRISWQYPLVELGTGILFAFFAAHYFFLPTTLIWLWLISILLVALFVYDLKHLELPDNWVLLLTILVVAGTLIFSRDTIVIRALSGLGLALLFYAMYALSMGRWIGGGDVKIAFALGMFVGLPGVLVLLGLAYVSGALVGLYLMAKSKAKGNTAVPFGPFLIGAAIISFIYSDQLAQWYLSLLY